MVELPSEFQMKTKQLLIINQLNKNIVLSKEFEKYDLATDNKIIVKDKISDTNLPKFSKSQYPRSSIDSLYKKDFKRARNRNPADIDNKQARSAGKRNRSFRTQ